MQKQIIIGHISEYLCKGESPKHNLDKNHIFYSIHNKILNGIPIEDQVNMLYHFEQIKKILIYSRTNKLHLAELTCRNLEELKLQYSDEIAYVGMKSIHLPMLAYLNYVRQNFEEAERNLMQSIGLLKSLINNGIEECKIASLEQYFNLFKINFKVGNIEHSANIAFQIILYTTKSNSDLITFPFLNDETDELNCCHYYVNNILQILFNINKKEAMQLNSTQVGIITKLKNLIEKVSFKSTHCKKVKDIVLFTLNRNCNLCDFKEDDIIRIISPTTPTFLQYIVLETLSNHLLKNKDETDLIHRYYKEVLGINHIN